MTHEFYCTDSGWIATPENINDNHNGRIYKAIATKLGNRVDLEVYIPRSMHSPTKEEIERRLERLGYSNIKNSIITIYSGFSMFEVPDTASPLSP